MAWTSPRTWVVGETVTAALLNVQIRDNWDFFTVHKHRGLPGDGSALLAGLDSATFDFISTRPAPGASKVIVYAKSGGLYWREGAAGAETQAAETTHTH